MNADLKKLLLLGGYGSTGWPLARLLLRNSDVRLVIAGRDIEKAATAADRLNKEFSGNRVAAARADAADQVSLEAAFTGADMVVITSSTVQYTRNLVETALAAGCDWFDVNVSAEKLEILRSWSSRIAAAGRLFITDGGFHPGLPAAMVRYAAQSFDRIESANIGSVIQLDWPELDLSPATIEEFAGEFAGFRTDYFKRGEWQKAGFLGMMFPRWMDFGTPWERRYVLPMFLEEMRPLPDLYPGLQETGFYVGGFNWFTDWVISPIIWLWQKLLPGRGVRAMGRLLRWGLDSFSRPPYGTMLKLEASGMKDQQKQALTLSIAHPDGYELTAIPAAACLLQWLDGQISGPGVHFQALAVEPRRFVRDIERLGADVKNTPHPPTASQ